MIWILFLLSFFGSWLIAYMIRRQAIVRYLKAQAQPLVNRVHIVPEGGGLSIVIMWYFCCMVLACYHPEFMPVRLLFAMFPGLLLVGAALYDERMHFPPLLKLLFQAIAIAAAMFIMGGVHSFSIGQYVWTSPFIVILANVLTFFLFMWLINLFPAFNGIDAYLGFEASQICVLTMLILPINNPLFFLFAAIGGFLVLNWHPSRVQMGQASAQFLGFVFSVMALYFVSLYQPDIPEAYRARVTYYSPSLLLYIMLCGVAFFDATYTLFRRIANHENLLAPTQNHLYQRLLLSGYSHTWVLMVSIMLNCVLVLFAFIAYYSRTAWVSLTVLVLMMVVFAFYAYWVERRYPYVTEKVV